MQPGFNTRVENMGERLAKKDVRVGKKGLPSQADTYLPTYPAPTPGTNRRDAKYKRTIPLDHPRTGPNNSLYVMDGGSTRLDLGRGPSSNRRRTYLLSWPLSVTEPFLSTNAPKEERPCTRVGAPAEAGRGDGSSARPLQAAILQASARFGGGPINPPKVRNPYLTYRIANESPGSYTLVWSLSSRGQKRQHYSG